MKNQEPIETDDNAKPDEYECPYCQRMFRTADDLTLHIVTRHSQTKLPRITGQTGQADSGTR